MHLDSKRGVEQPQLIVYVLFTIILTLSGIYVAFVYLGGINITFDFHDYASRLNVVTSKMIYSTDCFGIESSYIADDGTHYQKEIGVINWTKFNSTKTIPEGCVSAGDSPVWVELTFRDSKISDTAWSCYGCPAICEKAKTDCYSSCQIGSNLMCIPACDKEFNNCVNSCMGTCKEPIDQELSDPDKWQQSERKILVFIQNGTSIGLGQLRVRLQN